MESLHAKVTLHDGVAMPWLGLGVWQAPPSETYTAVRAALEIGYRHIDTAKIYANEKDVGRALRDSDVPREEIFVTTKLWNSDHGYERARRGFEGSLRALGLEYIDLYLLHWPQPARHDSWRTLIELKNEGKTKSIGVSNFTIAHLTQLLAATDVPPSVNQVELHPFLYQRDLLAFCQSHEIQLEAYSPLVRGERMDHPVLAKIAAAHARTPAQVLLRWSLQHRIVVIPKSVKPERIAENANVFDFALTAEEMTMLDGLNENLRTCWDPSQVT